MLHGGKAHGGDGLQTHALLWSASTKRKVAPKAQAVEGHKYLGHAPGEGQTYEEEVKLARADQRIARK